MSLVRDRFDRRWQQLVELGRSRLPALAPAHTDHNAHDPGITLMELLAAVAEAQMRAATRVRKDEREAYAALMGVRPEGTRPAEGVLWPDRVDPGAAANTLRESVIIEPDAAIRLRESEEPVFHPVARLLWAPGSITRLHLRAAAGGERDFTALNARGGGFAPFGDEAGPRATLVLEFRTAGRQGLLPPGEGRARGAYWALGVRAEDRSGGVGALPSPGCSEHPLLSVTLVTAAARFELPVFADTSAGMARTGYLLLDVSGLDATPQSFALELRAPRGLPRPPRVLAIEASVVPITQRTAVVDEAHRANGRADFGFALERTGLCHAAGEEPLAIATREGGERRPWSRRASLAELGPSDRAYELDAGGAQVRFGNGVNGAIPAADAQVLASYAVSDGEAGNVARNRRWLAQGFVGVFGTNPDPVSGGRGRSSALDARRAARRQLVEDGPLVSAADIAAAAKRLPLLEVARAWMPRASEVEARAGVVRLVAMRARGTSSDAMEAETPRWLAAVRAALAPRLTLGTRLVVAAPRYAGFTVRAEVIVSRGRDPADVSTKIREALAQRMRLVPAKPGDAVRAAGVPVTVRDVTAWIRAVDGVADVPALRLFEGRIATETVKPRADGLPRLDLAASELDVHRSEAP